MNKTLLKLSAAGTGITVLLALLMISGCQAKTQTPATEKQLTTGTENSITAEQTQPSDEAGDMSDAPDTQPDYTEGVAPTENDSDIDVPFSDLPTQEATKPQPDKPEEQPTEPTPGNDQSNDQPTQPNQSETEPKYSVSLKDYEAMTPDQQLAYMQSFPSMDDYIAWLQWARSEDTDDGVHLEGEGGVVVIP